MKWYFAFSFYQRALQDIRRKERLYLLFFRAPGHCGGHILMYQESKMVSQPYDKTGSSLYTSLKIIPLCKKLEVAMAHGPLILKRNSQESAPLLKLRALALPTAGP